MQTHLVIERLQAIKKQIYIYEEKYSRPHQTQLLAVSKGQSTEKIKEAYRGGQFAFGENYLQEALAKMLVLEKINDIEWHYIGKIQSNKAKKIAAHFAWVHSVDSIKVAQRLNDHRPLHLPPLNICIEINISHEKSKLGTSENQALALARFCETLPRLKLRGLMAIPALVNDLNLQRQAFRHLVDLFLELKNKGLKLDTLSMGTSEDYEAAIAEGASIVRIGTALFGPRTGK